MSKIKFYSEYDMAAGWVLEMIIEKIISEDLEAEWDIKDLLEFHNIIKYLNVENFSNYISQRTDIDIEDYRKKINKKIGKFINFHKDDYIKFFDKIDFDESTDYFEVFENFKLYSNVDSSTFSEFIEKEKIEIFVILQFKKTTNNFNEVVKEKILSNPKNAEIIILKYLKENKIYLPSTLNESEILAIINEYIDSQLVNINILKRIITFPPDKGLIIPDKIKLKAMRKEKEEQEKIFSGKSGFETSIMISYQEDQEEEVLFSQKGTSADIKISQKWIKENTDYPTLWNNFIYLFGFVDMKMRLNFDSKKSENSALQSLLRLQAKHLYNESTVFRFKEMMSLAMMQSYVNVLKIYDIRLEEMIEWFFKVYLKEEFHIENFIVKMPTVETTYFEKCRTILPEIDRIYKQYNILVEDGIIDHELIQISSSSFKTKEIKSFNEMKYVYSSSDWFNTASHLLFSDQSGIYYLSDQDNRIENFYTLITTKKVKKVEFSEPQVKRIQWLFDKELVYENSLGNLEFVDLNTIYILKELYYSEVINYWHCSNDLKYLLKELSTQNLIEIKSSLFSRNEQDYFDYYLNKSKFTNGRDIRNKYLHGTNTNNERDYELDYYTILRIIVIIILKINDDVFISSNK